MPMPMIRAFTRPFAFSSLRNGCLRQALRLTQTTRYYQPPRLRAISQLHSYWSTFGQNTDPCRFCSSPVSRLCDGSDGLTPRIELAFVTKASSRNVTRRHCMSCAWAGRGDSRTLDDEPYDTDSLIRKTTWAVCDSFVKSMSYAIVIVQLLQNTGSTPNHEALGPKIQRIPCRMILMPE
jgi:hypothetical protein